jgi:hypothetical protein
MYCKNTRIISYQRLFMRCSALCRSQRYLNSSQAMQNCIFCRASGSAARAICYVSYILTCSLVAVSCACGVDRLQAESGLFGSPVSLGAQGTTVSIAISPFFARSLVTVQKQPCSCSSHRYVDRRCRAHFAPTFAAVF